MNLKQTFVLKSTIFHFSSSFENATSYGTPRVTKVFKKKMWAVPLNTVMLYKWVEQNMVYGKSS